MRRKLGYRWLVAGLIVVILAINLVLSFFIPVRTMGPLLLAEGLILDGSGALIALAPDITGINKRFEPTEKINRIETAQNRLFLEGSLTKDIGPQEYHELVNILSENRDVETPPDRIVAPSGGYGASAALYFQYEKDDWSREDYNGEEEHPWEKYNKIRIAPTGVMDSRVSQYLDNLRTKGHQFGFFAGLALLSTGFLLQLCSVLYKNL